MNVSTGLSYFTENINEKSIVISIGILQNTLQKFKWQ